MLAAVGSETARAYLELGAVILALGLGARLSSRLELSPIGLYLLIGLVLGSLDIPQLSGDFVEFAASLGVILLLFLLGLEYTAQELAENLRRFLPVGIADAALNFPPGVAFGLLLGWEPLAAVLLGGVTWVSSSGIVAKALGDLGRLGNRETPAVLAVLVLEDLAMTLYLPLIASLLVGGGLLAALGSVAAALSAAAVVLVLALRYGSVVGRLVEHRSEEAVLLTALGLVLIVAGIAEKLQVSAGVGAFLVGIALSGEVAHRTRALLAPIRDFNAALFFLFFALQIDTRALLDVAAPALVLAVATAGTKIATGWLGAARAGVGRRGRARAGLTLVPRGEFSIVIAGLGVGAGLEPQLAPLAAAYVLVLALAGPVLMRFPDALPALPARFAPDGARGPSTLRRP
ncbi:MAG TPA: cation:proton antiporter [Solirubrobacteraceae bacterium]|nr:cation:proton antiporter [Solirubrobacteraceae bacterium]